MSSRQRVWVTGEDAAVRYLERQGIVVLARNVRLRDGEIDIVGRESDEYVFVEVKTRVGGADTAPDEAIDEAKLGRLERLAERYLQEIRQPDADWRVDVVAVVVDAFGRTVTLEHLKGAFL